MQTRDIIVIGASTGGIPALVELLRPLPAGVPAALLVVVHTAPEGGGLLPEVLERGGGWTSAYARDGEPISHGRIYVAPPDYHLLVRGNQLRITRGPRENRFRPAIDPLFRTASLEYGPRVIGIVLSGGLDDGTHGLELIKRHGGIAIVQDPVEAIAPSMPLSAIQHVEVDYILKAADIGRRLPILARELIEPRVVRVQRSKEPDVAEGTAQNKEKVSGAPSPFTCPECGGTLWELEGGRMLRYRCHVGHGYTAESLVADQSDSLENAFWSALRTLEEHSMLRRRMAEHARAAGRETAAREYEREARQTELRESQIRGLLQQERPAKLESDRRRRGRNTSATTKLVESRPGTRTRRVNR